MAAKDSSLSQRCDVRVVRGFGAIRHFGSSTTVEGPSFLIVDALPLEAQVFLDGRPFGSATETVLMTSVIDRRAFITGAIVALTGPLSAVAPRHVHIAAASFRLVVDQLE